IAMACRNHGARNPNAQLRLPLTLDRYMDSPYVVEPLRRADICLVSDAAAAVIVMSARRAQQRGGAAAAPLLGYGPGDTDWEAALLASSIAASSAKAADKMAGCGPEHIDVAQIYDCFTIAALMALEDYGFCRKGEGGHWVEGGRIEHGGELPNNPSGGLLSET